MIVIDKINNYLNNHDSKDTNYSIAMYIKNNIEYIPLLSTTQLSEASYVSQATVSRFIMKLGYNNYSEFKEEVIKYLGETADFIKRDGNILAYKEMFKLFNCQLDLDKLFKIAHLISENRNVYVTGLNYCYFMSEYFQTECHHFRKVVDVIPEVSDINKLTNKDLLIVISTAGNYFFQNRLARKTLSESRAEKVLIGIESMGSSIENLFDHKLILNLNVGNTNNHYLIMAILDQLIEMVHMVNSKGTNTSVFPEI